MIFVNKMADKGSGKLAINDVSDILNINSYRVAINLMNQWGLKTSGAHNLEQSISRLADHWVKTNRKQPLQQKKVMYFLAQQLITFLRNSSHPANNYGMI